MYTITGSNDNHYFRIKVSDVKRAINIADRKAEEGYSDIKIESDLDQLPLFNGGDK
jgi:hypothetical protein